MKWLFLLMLSACGIDYPVATHCDSDLFGQGVDSVLPISCDLMKVDADVALSMIRTYTQIPEQLYRDRMRHVHVEITSRESWELNGGTVYGETNINRITLSRHGHCLDHESIHAFNQVGWTEDFGTMVAMPSETARDGAHENWGPLGYWDADFHFMSYYADLYESAVTQ